MGYSPDGLKGAPTKPGAGLGVRGWLRWIWRQLTSMRVALMLLLLLAVVALPGSFFPQSPQDPTAVMQYLEDHPTSGPWLERFGLFDVYGSPWFSAVYILLFTSLVGCIVPRIWVHIRSLRSGPAKMPRRLGRFPVYRQGISALDASTAQSRARRRLRRSKVATDTETGDVLTVAAETGYGRETGNIVFHLALVGVLIAMAWGQLVHYRGQALVVEGDSFVNSPVDYDSFDSGSLFADEDLDAFRFTLDSFESEFTLDARARGFRAEVTVTEPGGGSTPEVIEVNHPLDISGARVYLTGNGYAPDLSVTDSDGEVAFSGPVPFMPQDEVYTSTGVVTVPDANGGTNQLGFRGTFLPSAIPADDGAFVGSAHPDPIDPVLVLELWEGDLGLDEGVPTNLLSLDTTNMTQVMVPSEDDPDEEVPFRAVLEPGETAELPDDGGDISFEGLPRFASLDLRYDPSIHWMGAFATLAFGGLVGSLFMRRRRIWLRLSPQSDGTTMVDVGALARGDDPGLEKAVEKVLADLEMKDDQ